MNTVILAEKRTLSVMNKLILAALCWMTFTSSAFAQKNEQIPFPSFRLLKMDSLSYLTNNDIAEHKNTVFINFSPTCEHCQRTIKSILDNIVKFTETQFILTSFEEFSTIRKFYFDNGLNSFSSVFIGQETDYSLTRQIKYSSFPCLVLFNRDNTYLKTIDEESNAKMLLKALKLNYK